MISGAKTGVYIGNAGGTLSNAGRIIGQTDDGVKFIDGGYVGNIVAGIAVGTIAGGIYGVDISGAAGTVLNAGAILGLAGDGVQLADGGYVSNAASGVISGGTVGVYVAGKFGSVANAGTIHGGAEGVAFAGGGYVTNQLGGVISGGTYGVYAGGTGQVTVVNDGYIGGGSFGVASGTLAGITLLNYGTLEGGKYGVWAHDTGSNALTNQAVIESRYNVAVFIGNRQATAAITGTLINAGTISGARYGVQIGYAGNTRANVGTVVNSGSISGGEDGVAMFAGGDVTNEVGGNIYGGTFGVYAGGTGHVTVINDGYIGGGSFGVASGTLAGITLLNYGTLEGGRYGVWEHASGVNSLVNEAVIESHNVAVFIGQSATGAAMTGTLVNAGSIAGGRYGVQIGYLGNTQANAGTIFNTGSIHGGHAAVALFAGGYLSNASGAEISGGIDGVYVTGASGFVLNAGSIFGGDVGVWLAQGGVENTVSGDPLFGTIDGGQIGVEVSNAAGSVLNAGTIIGDHGTGVVLNDGGYVSNVSGGLISGGATGISVLNVYGSVVNAGLVAAGQVGIYLGAGGSLGNGGTIRTSELDSVGIEAARFANIANAGTIYGAGGGTGILLEQGGSVFNAGTIEHLDQYGVVVRGAAGTLVNTGLVYGFNRGVALYDGGSVANDGLITAGGDAVYVTGGAARVVNFVSVSGFLAGVLAEDGGTVVNAGSIFSGGGEGFGIEGATVALHVINTGSITASYGVGLGAGGTIFNQGGIYAQVQGVHAAGVAATLFNSGRILGDTGAYLGAGGYVGNAGAGTIGGHFYGVLFNGAAGTLINAGSIGSATRDGVGLVAGGYVRNLSGGTISGARYGVYAAAAAGTVVNAGSIGGLRGAGLRLEAGGYAGNRAGGTITGGTDGVYAVDAAGTVINAGRIAGAANGVVLGDGGLVDNTVALDPVFGTITGGTNGVYAVDAAGAVINAGGIGGGTGDGVKLAAGGFVHDLVDGTISGGIAGVYAGGAAGTVVNAGRIAGDAYGVALRDGGAVNNTFAGDPVFGTITGGTIGVYIGGAAGTVVNSGLIAAADLVSTAVSLAAGGTVANIAGALIAGYRQGIQITGAASAVYNAGTILADGASSDMFGGYGGVHMESGGALTNALGGVIGGADYGVVLNSTFSTLVNAGMIAGSLNSGVILQAGGYVENAATILGGDQGVYINNAAGTVVNAGSIGGGGSAVWLRDGGTIDNLAGGRLIGADQGVYFGISFANAGLRNAGTIIGRTRDGVVMNGGGSVGNSGYIYGQGGGVLVDNGVGTVSNSGIILSAAYRHAGVLLNDGGAVENSKSIHGAGYGVFIDHGAGMVSNGSSGTITSGDIGAYTDGVVLNDGGAVDNAGVILGGAAGLDVQGGFGVVQNTGLVQGGTVGAAFLDGVHLYNNIGGTIAGAGAGVLTAGRFFSKIFNYGVINGGSLGVGVYQTLGGSVLNEDRITALSGSGTGAAFGAYGYLANGFGATVTGGTAGVGVLFRNDGSAVNAGLIQGGYGVAAEGRYGVVLNIGSIVGDTAGVALLDGGAVVNPVIARSMSSYVGVISGSIGVAIEGMPGTVFNEGTIFGGAAAGDAGVLLGDGGDVLNLVATHYGTLFTGLVDGQTGVKAAGKAASILNAGSIGGVATGVALADGGIVNNETYGLTAGTISGGVTGVEIAGGAGTVVNQGVIEGGSADGVTLGGGGTVLNTGMIAGLYDGVAAAGTVAVQNAGMIAGTVGAGVVLTAGTLLNEEGGVIAGGNAGLVAGGGALVTNAGLIEDAPAPDHAGAVLEGGARLVNLSTGTIAGATGVLLRGEGASLFDAGTIASTDGGAAIAIAPGVDPATVTLTTGADVIGTIDGGGTDGQIELTGAGSLSNTIGGFGAGSALTIAPGADWAASGSWTVATVTNRGIFQPGNLDTPLTLMGNFVQASQGTLQVVVTPTLSSRFIVDGSAVLSGDLDYVFAPGTYEEKQYDFLTATQGVTGGFSTVSYDGEVPAALTHTTNAVTQGANLVLGAGGSAPSGPPARVVVTPADSGVFAAQAQAAAELSQQATDMLLDKAVNGSDAEAAACAAGAQMNPARLSPRGTSLAGAMTSAAASAFCNEGGWVDADGGDVSQDGAGGYGADTAGFTAGIDRVFGLGTRVGFAVGYDATNLDDNAHGQGSSDVTRLSLYAARPVGRLVLAGVLSEGILSATTDRATGLGQMGESHAGNIVSGGVAVTTTVTLGAFAVAPSVGVRFADVSGAGFAEGRPRGIAGAFAVAGQIPGYASVQPYAGLGIGRNFVTQTGVVVSPHVSVGYEVQAADAGRSARLVAADGTVFGSDGARQDGGDALLGAGISAGEGNWALYVSYAAHVAGNWSAQTGEAGLRVGF